MMRFHHYVLSVFIAAPIAFLTWLGLYFGAAQPFWVSVGLALGVGGLCYSGAYGYAYYIFLKRHRLTRREYVYIRKNLKEAKEKIRRLQKAFVNVRSISAFRRMFTIQRLVKRIYALVKKEPKRFFQSERFFFYHLDSVVELTEKHAFLTAKSVPDPQLNRSLWETQRTIDALIQSIEQDLRDLLTTDLDQLEFELNVARHSLKKWNHSLMQGGRSARNE